MRIEDFDYALPPELIAQEPSACRDAARLMTIERGTGAIGEGVVADLPGILKPGDLLVVNDTRVIPARLLDKKTKYFINPGSIGQPRDKNPQPSYIIYDSDKREIFFVRFSYNFKVTQSKIRGAGLPEILASRIELGV